MGDNQGLVKALEKLAELITVKAEGVASPGALVPQPEVIQKIELMPNEIKMEGVTNYLSWSRRALLILRTKGLEGYVRGEVDEPANRASEEWKKWSVIDSLVVAWLLNSLTPSIAAAVETLPHAAEVWKTLETLYSGKGNIMLMAQIEDRVNELKQGDKSVMEYVAELQHLWADLDHYDPLELPHSECIVATKKWVERRRVMKFLKGLSSEFEGRRAGLFHQPKVPSLEEAVAAMAQEEVMLKLTRTGEANASRSAFTVSEWKETRECFNCGEKGHISINCTAQRREIRGRGRGYSRGGYRGVRGRGNSRGSNYSSGFKANLANLATQEEGTSTTPQGESKSRSQEDNTFGNFAHFVYTGEGNFANASISTHDFLPDWILDSGASKHVAGTSTEFESYTQYPITHCETIQTADGTSQPIKGVGSVQCTPTIKLSDVLHVPAFPVNLLSLSALIDQIDCRITLDKKICLIQERMTGRKLGTGTRRSGLWYMDRDVSRSGASPILAVLVGVSETMAMIHHCRMGHMAFDKMSKMFPDVMRGVDKSKLVCDACEYAKHTRISYLSKGLRSISPFMLIHSDVWTCPVVSVSGMKYFVTFIDCHTRMTWVYLMRHKDEVFQCFQEFYAYVRNQFNVQVQVIRSDNGTEYVNKQFGGFLSAQGIMHQTSCPDTPAQNGVAERKNQHILEVARSLMFTMNVPKFLWSEAVMTATFLINRMPSKMLGMKSPCEMLFGKNKFSVPPKLFGCTCFVRDHRSAVGKLDPRAVKCIFVGYPAGQRGYKCWSPAERHTFVSMDVTFRESEPFYGEKTDLSTLFEELDHSQSMQGGQEGECNLSGECSTNGDKEQPIPTPKIVGSFIPIVVDGAEQQRWQRPNEERNPQVYTRRKRGVEEQVHEEQSKETMEQGEQSEETQATGSSSEVESYENSSTEEASPNLPIALKKEVARKTLSKGNLEHDISNYVTYEALSPSFRAFVASLQAVIVPKDWKEARQDPKWCEAMREELEALRKNKTWELANLPYGKKAVSCKWIFTVKQNPEGKVERYKARLVARGYNQTYGIDYDETFAPVAKMNTVRILISCAANFGWPLHQLDVKNAFLHGDLQEEVYMEIPPGLSTPGTVGKVCRLRKSLYGLKQSPRAWFDRFRQAVCSMEYKQCNGDHTVFYKHSKQQITILAVYVDDIIITGDNEEEIGRLKKCLGKAFEVKDLGQLKYFLGIEVARSKRGIALSQRKYTLELLSDMGMLGCRAAPTPIEQNHKLTAQMGEQVNKAKYQQLVGKLLYLCHTRPDITYAVSVVSRYMHDPRSGHLDAVYRIMRYLKGSPGMGLWFKSNGHLNVDGYSDADWASCLDDRRSTSGYCVFVGGNLVSWRSKKQPVVSKSTAEAEYRAMSQGLSEMLWVRGLLLELKVLRQDPLNVWCDNKSAISIANNPVQHDRTKHVEIDRFFIKEKLDAGIIKITHVSSGQQVADCLTKGLGTRENNLACDKMGMIDIYHPS
ncbi:unnamed protein product [Triticum turgidum subsp. durum]|uniref:Polyprotein n=1 Tax=Triticum turgidum subsp. durum TaxID=4567 RepID=A0A9R0R3Y3_TRITD|nr:unnamed protein product [Triticum turgidum subsp. durum]